jgi:hypothetical protein
LKGAVSSIPINQKLKDPTINIIKAIYLNKTSYIVNKKKTKETVLYEFCFTITKCGLSKSKQHITICHDFVILAK